MKKLFLTSMACYVLDEFVNLLANKPSQYKIAFIQNAADPYDDKWFVDIDKNKLIELGFQIINLDITNSEPSYVPNILQECDIIFVSGGNTFYLLQEMKKRKIDILINNLVENGKIYIGSSAGTSIVCPNIELIKTIDSPGFAPELKSYKGLNLVPFFVIPHCDNKDFKDKISEILKENVNLKSQIIQINDNQAVWVDGNQIKFVESKNN